MISCDRLFIVQLFTIYLLVKFIIMTRCSVPFCSHKANHRFPKDPDLRNSWVKAIERGNFVPKDGSRICRRHFHRSDYVQVSRATGQPLQHRCLKKSTVPSVFPWNRKLVSSRHEVREERRKHHRTCRSFLEIPSLRHHGKDCRSMSSEIKFLWHKTLVPKTGRNSLKNKQFSQRTQTQNCLRWFATTEQLLSDDESVVFYTGLDNYAQFKLLLSTLMPMANEIKYQSKHVTNLTAEDQFLMLLVKLRRYKPDFEIGKMFGVNKTDVSNVIVTWVSFATDHWSLLDSWPNQDIVDSYMPETLKWNCPSNGVVRDAGIPIKVENVHNAVKSSFSQYKIKKSLKFIAGCGPDGFVCYCLEQKVRSTGELKIRDDDDLPNPDVMSVDLKLAERVSIEKLVGSTKTFKILAGALNQTYAPLSSRIFSVCLMICSFKVGIVTVK